MFKFHKLHPQLRRIEPFNRLLRDELDLCNLFQTKP